jgi:hypothetical protein
MDAKELFTEEQKETLQRLVATSGLTVGEVTENARIAFAAIQRAMQPILETIRQGLSHVAGMAYEYDLARKRERRIHYKKKRSQAKNWNRWKKRKRTV